MTTAHRPTWKAAVGRENEGGWSAGGAVSTQRSALDAPAHTKLKFREAAADSNKKEILRQSLLALEQAEQTAATSLRKSALSHRPVDLAVEERSKQRLLKQTAEVDDVKLKEKYDDSDVDEEKEEQSSEEEEEESDLDNDDNDSDLDGSSSSDEDDDEDDEAALQAELAKLRAEREEAKRKADEEAAAEESAKQEEAALLGNPLLNQDGGVGVASKMKRRWNDDVVFRNQAKGEPAPKKRFINDTVRNDFHKRFLNKFIR